jgi:hypothetical protein
MKNIVFAAVTASALFTGCAFADANAAVTSSTAPAYQSKTTSTISIAPRDNLIVATTLTSWDTKASDHLVVKWLAPKGSFCSDSTFVLVRGPNSTHDVSWAYRTVVHTNSKGNTITCTGHWVAQVVNTNNGQVLASAGYDVTPGNKPVTTNTTTSN